MSAKHSRFQLAVKRQHEIYNVLKDIVSTESEQVDPLVHRFAVATCFVALLPIGIGTLVTTLRAGMAFTDWPTSDGQNMLLYPWLNAVLLL